MTSSQNSFVLRSRYGHAACLICTYTYVYTYVQARVVCLELTLRHVRADQRSDRVRNSNSAVTPCSNDANSERQANCLTLSSTQTVFDRFWHSFDRPSTLVIYPSTSFPKSVLDFRDIPTLDKLRIMGKLSLEFD